MKSSFIGRIRSIAALIQAWTNQFEGTTWPQIPHVVSLDILIDRVAVIIARRISRSDALAYRGDVKRIPETTATLVAFG